MIQLRNLMRDRTHYFRRAIYRTLYNVPRSNLEDMVGDDDGFIEVFILNFKSPAMIMVRLPNSEPDIKEVEDQLKDIFNVPHLRYPAPPPKDVAIIKWRVYALYSNIKRQWVRAMATETIVGKPQMTIFELIDHGTFETRPVEHARLMPDALCELPAQAHRLTIAPEQYSNHDWSGKFCMDMRAKVMNKMLKCRIKEFIYDKEIYKADLYTEEPGGPVVIDVQGETRQLEARPFD